MSERLGTADHAPIEALVALHRRLGRRWAGLLITGHVMIDGHALGEPGKVAVSDRRDRPLRRAWAEAAQGRRARVGMQINHPGRRSPRTRSAERVAPSAVAVRGMAGAFATPRALTDQRDPRPRPGLRYARKVRQVTALPLLLTGGSRSATGVRPVLGRNDRGQLDVPRNPPAD